MKFDSLDLLYFKRNGSLFDWKHPSEDIYVRIWPDTAGTAVFVVGVKNRGVVRSLVDRVGRNSSAGEDFSFPIMFRRIEETLKIIRERTTK